MITALDSSVIIDVLIDDTKWKDPSLRALKQARAEGQLIVSSFVLAEITPVVGQNNMPGFLKDWDLDHVGGTLQVALDAGRAFSQYLQRGGKGVRVIADFLIGAHARHHADRLLTRDAGFIRDYFKKDKIWLVQGA
ncbi:MAG: PIN domain-containing protein [Opitutae bacterium]|nr:PIN domain-containing protein [Opitutae bacterium]